MSTRVAGCDRSLSGVSKGARANNCSVGINPALRVNCVLRRIVADGVVQGRLSLSNWKSSVAKIRKKFLQKVRVEYGETATAAAATPV